MMRVVSVVRQTDDRYKQTGNVEVVIDLGLKSGKLGSILLTPAETVDLARELLMRLPD
jgi:hypothetical protein